MPHSVSPEADSSNAAAEETMVDAPAPVNDGVGQGTDDDITMAETNVIPAAANGEDKKDVKLEDLFADVESDDEFPSSRPLKDEFSSSPAAAASPM